eukprot:m.35712 g.35712  ORF g.35712 m.35712 type:complete len:180 (-) comp17190_c0_seq1:166-705(-)
MCMWGSHFVFNLSVVLSVLLHVGTIVAHPRTHTRTRVGNLAAPCREISGSGVTGFAGAQLAVFNGGGHHSVFNASSTPPTWTYSNNTPGRSPWSKMGVTSVGDRYAVFGGGNGNNVNIEIFDGLENRWMFSKYNLSLGREQIMAAGTNTMVAFAGGSIGDYKPTGYTSLIEIFNISALV